MEMDSSDEGTDNEGQRVRSTEKKKKSKKNRSYNPELRVFRLDDAFYENIAAPQKSMKERYLELLDFQSERKKKLGFIPILHSGCSRYAHLHIVCISSATPRTTETVKTIFKNFFKVDEASETYKDFIASGTKYSLGQLNLFDTRYLTPKYFTASHPFATLHDIADYEASYSSKKTTPVFDFFREVVNRGPRFSRHRWEEEFCDGEREQSLKRKLDDDSSMPLLIRSLPECPDELILKGKSFYTKDCKRKQTG